MIVPARVQDLPDHKTNRAPETVSGPSLFPVPFLIVAAIALFVILPMFFLGNPSGHDFEFHVNSWMEVLSQWKQGILYPRWASQAHFGYGEARFLFYPPASWLLGAALGAVLPWHMVPGAFIWIALTAAGSSMFVLARRWLSARDAIFAAALYAANPYHFVIVYWRSAYAELLAAWLLPLLLLFVLRADHKGRRMIIPLALIVAAAWLTNAPAAVMVNYSLASLVIVAAILYRSPRPLYLGAVAVALGAALAGFYLIPAAYEEKWVNIAQVLSPGVRPQDNFLFTIFNDADHNRFNYLVSTVAVAEMLVLVAAAFLSRKQRPHERELWWSLASWAGAAMLLMSSITLFFWEHLPKLRFVQLPWRWLLCLNVAFAVFVTTGARRLATRLVLCLTLALVLFFVWHRIQAPWWDSRDDLAEMRDNFSEGLGYEGTDEYVPAGADSYEIKQEAPRVASPGRTKVRVEDEVWAPELKSFSVSSTEPGDIVIRLFNFPAWQVRVNGRLVSTQTTEETGQMVIPIGPGESEVAITFVRTWDRILGAAITVFALIILLMLVWKDRRNRVLRDPAFPTNSRP